MDIYVTLFTLIITVSGSISERYLEHPFKGREKDLRPVCDGTAVNVTLDLALRQVIELDAPEQALKASVWLRMIWHDCRLSWNISNYAGLTKVAVLESTVWVPDILLYDSVSTEWRTERDYKVSVYYDGKVEFLYPLIITSRCPLTVTKFPFDEQNCSLTFGSWANDITAIRVILNSPEGDLSSTLPNVEWDFISLEAVSFQKKFTCCTEPYSLITYHLFMRRKSDYYILRLLYPSILITFMSSAVFLIPVESGEKISFPTTLLLSLAVFHLMFGELLPPSAECPPFLAIYLGICIVLVACSCVSAVVVVKLYYLEVKVMPVLIRKIFLVKLSKFVGVTYRFIPSSDSSVFSDDSHFNAKENKEGNVLSMNKQEVNMLDKSRNETQDSNHSITQDWKTLARVIERLSAISFMLVLLVVTCVIFSLI